MLSMTSLISLSLLFYILTLSSCQVPEVPASGDAEGGCEAGQGPGRSPKVQEVLALSYLSSSSTSSSVTPGIPWMGARGAKVQSREKSHSRRTR